MIFEEKYFLCHILLTTFHCLVASLLEILGNMCIVIIDFPVCDVINFEINYDFLIKPFLYVTKKCGQKSQEREEFLT